MRCAECGSENRDSSRFCGSCGTALIGTCPHCDAPLSPGNRFCTACGEAVPPGGIAEDPNDADPAAERRRVSVLFVDIEDFTRLAETLDPEEVRTVQSRYFETARSVIAKYGGTIEKFIGDAVMAVWGAPVAHEDDADRAVRAALDMVDAVRRLGGVAANRSLAARAAVTSGEAAITLGAVGQGMVSGDLVNSAARLQGEAPSGGVLVDEVTRALAGEAAVYEPLGSIHLKGRAAPITAFRATAASGTSSSRRRGSHGGPFVGRDRELREVVDQFERVVRDGHSRLVSVSGIAGIGKSRLAWELWEHIEALPQTVFWHAGRAPAYGDEITFAAVAEMVRRRIRIADDAGLELARRQLRTTLTELVRDDEERAWMEPRVAVLLERGSIASFERDELFAAWRRFFERVSDAAPTILVFEDLQWADASLLDFIEHLAAWTRAHPILIVTLARPELLDRRPTWGADMGRFTSLHLERLTDDAMRELLADRAPGLSERLIRHILANAGGVPLYAVEVARMLAGEASAAPTTPTDDERRRGPRARASGPGVDVPDSLHGLIAARIDALPAADRRLLLAAAVLGRRFRPEALSLVARTDPEVAPRVDGLVRRELLVMDDDLASPGRGELSFVQDLVREVAYQTLSHAERRSLHLAAARYLETRPDDEVAESLASHLVEAHGLAPEHPDAHRLARRAVAALRRAGRNALRLHVPERAMGHLEHALRLTDTPEQRAVVLEEAAAAARSAARLDLAERHLRDLVELHKGAGRRHETLRARARLASVLLMEQRNEPAMAELEAALRATRRIETDDAGVELAAQLARARLLVGDDRGSLEWAERALGAAERLGLDAIAADVMATRGTARFRLGDEDGGMVDLREAVTRAEAAGYLATELRARNNLAWLVVTDDPRTGLETARAAVALATTMGVGDMAVQLAEVATAAAVDTGEWEWALATIDELEAGVVPEANRINLAALVATIRALRGEDDPMQSIQRMEPLAADTDPQVRAGVDFARAWEAFVRGDFATARELASGAAEASFGTDRFREWSLAVRASLWLGDRAGAAEALARLEAKPVRGRATQAERATLLAGLAALDADDGARASYDRAAESFRELELPLHLALCQLDAHRLLREEHAPAEAVRALQALGADGLLRAAGFGGDRTRPAQSRRPTARTASRSDGARHRRPAPDRPAPSG